MEIKLRVDSVYLAFVSLPKTTPMYTFPGSLFLLLLVVILMGGACVGPNSPEAPAFEDKKLVEISTPSMIGTWQLLTVLTIENGDSVLTDYTLGIKGIKMLNETHFAFFQHDLIQGKDSSAVYVSGGGPYTYVDGIYTEHLEYCNFRVYENNTFEFEVEVKGDTLIQRGEEEVAEAGISKYIIETYVRVIETGN